MISIIGGSGFVVGSRLIELIGESKCINLDIKPSPFFNNITKIADIRVKNDLNYIKNSESVILLLQNIKIIYHPYLNIMMLMLLELKMF